jgi:hypothetical protein
VAKALQIPIDTKVTQLSDLPFTISYVARKRTQIDSLNELPKEKRPPERLIWEGTTDDLDEWLDRVLYKREKPDFEFVIDDNEIE